MALLGKSRSKTSTLLGRRINRCAFRLLGQQTNTSGSINDEEEDKDKTACVCVGLEKKTPIPK